MTAPSVVLEKYPYRYVQCGLLEINGKPDCRIQKYNDWTKPNSDIYYCDNEDQLLLAIEDVEYTKWLDPDPEVGAYRKF